MSPVKVLVVEDESIVALDLQHRLRVMGYSVVGLAATGPAALQLGLALRPDIVLMDIRLKGPLSGIETAEQMRAQINLPVIYLTAYADPATLERARVSEPYGYVIKPFEDRELSITIEIALYRHQIETRLRDSEAQMRSAHDELERRVGERTGELTRVNEQLRLEIAARERAQAARAGAQEERRRLAQEIHDSVTQSVFSLIFTTQAARKSAELDASEPIEQTLGEVEDIARQVLKELRLLLYQLRSPLLDHAGLTEALRYRLDAVETRAGVKASLAAPARMDMSPDAEEGAYRVAMEALNNSLKHAKATEVTVEIRSEGDYVVLTVTDNGIGFDVGTKALSAGLGLAGMQERAARSGGHVIVRSTRDRGTSVALRIPRFARDAEEVAMRVTV